MTSVDLTFENGTVLGAMEDQPVWSVTGGRVW